VRINLRPEVVDYFKGLAEETGLLYQKLIDLYLLDCARKRKKLTRWLSGDEIAQAVANVSVPPRNSSEGEEKTVTSGRCYGSTGFVMSERNGSFP
jgi:hypothetical protein